MLNKTSSEEANKCLTIIGVKKCSVFVLLIKALAQVFHSFRPISTFNRRRLIKMDDASINISRWEPFLVALMNQKRLSVLCGGRCLLLSTKRAFANRHPPANPFLKVIKREGSKMSNFQVTVFLLDVVVRSFFPFFDWQGEEALEVSYRCHYRKLIGLWDLVRLPSVGGADLLSNQG